MRKALTTFGKFVILLASFIRFKSFVILYTELLHLYVIANVKFITLLHYMYYVWLPTHIPTHKTATK